MIPSPMPGLSLETLVVAVPLLGAVCCFLWPGRSVLPGLFTSMAVAATVIGLGWQVGQHGVLRHALGGWQAPLGIDLQADGLSLLMLAVTAVVGLAVSIYSSAYFGRKKAASFWPLWCFLWAALNALFLSADIFNLYVTLELLGLAAVALVALAGDTDALSAAMRYLLVSLTGSLFYLLGVALLYHGFGTLDMVLLGRTMAATPPAWAAMGLMSVGLLLKTALFPLHFWLPPAHAGAPAPVSALLSALVVKASFYILIRLWLLVFPFPGPAPGQLLGLLGTAAILWGGMQALRQTRLKLLVAYSTVVQIGYLFLAFPLAATIGWHGAIYLLLSHAVAKTAMFLATGNILFHGGHDRIADLDRVARHLPLTLGAFALAGVSLMGLPPSGGFISKWLLLEASIRSGQWWWAMPLIAGGLLTGAYVFRVIGHAFTPSDLPRTSRTVPLRMEWTALLMAMLAIALGLVASWPLALMDTGLPFGGGT
ncbi:complex I subunit 5 family protein [Thermodesulfobacteriota bacterium B35]